MNSKIVTARRVHRCATCNGTVLPGAQYMRYTVFPGDDTIGADVPYEFVECQDCVLTRVARKASS